ncbi:MAG: penicillin-binding protein 2 [Rhodospirillaceae bacterium]|nr:penicillin-binding protein 2 [Rhodospirillaceae bacterium]
MERSWKFSKLADPRYQPYHPSESQNLTQSNLDRAQNRLVIAGSFLILGLMAIFLRLIDVSLWNSSTSPRTTQSFINTNLAIVKRADIVDRNGVILATSLPTYSLYANPREMLDRAEAAAKLVKVFPDLNYDQLLNRFVSDRSFVWVKRNLSPAQSQVIWRLGIPGLQFVQEERRGYPLGSLVAHVVGFTDVDNKGLSGIERSFDSQLTETGEPLRLSIDIRIQHIVKQELSTAIKDFSAIGGMGLVLDVRTGEVLAMVSLPDFDPNNPSAASPEELFNRNTLGVYEMGSTFKIFNTALALDSGLVKITDQFDPRIPIKVGGFVIHDYERVNRMLTVPEIMMLSSNIASARMAMVIGSKKQQEFFEKIGLLDSVSLELPELAHPLYPKVWRDISAMTIAYGHGIAVTPLHLAVGVSAIVNDGKFHPATLVARSPHDVVANREVIKIQTSQQLRQIMRLVVESGTGKKADLGGYFVGGKTGTAEKQIAGAYKKDSRLASFISIFPVYEPRYLLLVMVDEPKPNATSHGFATGGWVAAPVSGRIIKRLAPLLDVLPVSDMPAVFVQNNIFIKTSLAGE